MGIDRWQAVTVQRGKPRVYIQQYLDLKLPEPEYEQIAKQLGYDKPYEEEAAAHVMESYIEDLADGSQCDSVHVQRGDGLVVLMTVVSYPYRQESFDRLMAAYMAKKALGQSE